MNEIVQALEHASGGHEYLFVAERCRTLYIRVPKAACTTMLWGLLELEGHDPSTMHHSRNPLLSEPDTVVHDMDIYPVPTLRAVSADLADKALTDPQWLRVAVVRNPYARLYSAWESKILLRPPGNRRFRPLPDLVESKDGIDVGASFRSFVACLADERGRWMADEHFARQTDLIPTAVLDDIELVPTAGIPDLFERLSGRARTVVTPRRSNKGLGIDGTAFLDDETAQTIARLYGADFELTGVDPSAYTPGENVVLDSVALSLLKLASARSARAVQLNVSYQQLSKARPVAVLRRAVHRLSGR